MDHFSILHRRLLGSDIFDTIQFIIRPGSLVVKRLHGKELTASSILAPGSIFRLVGAARSAAHGWRCAKHDWPSGDENTPYNLMEVKYKQTAKVLP